MTSHHGPVASPWQRAAFAAVALLGVATAGHATDYPGRATDLKPGDRPTISIEASGANDVEPPLLRVRAGTDVTWLNTTDGEVSIRFDQPIAAACGTPVNFGRSVDGTSYASDLVLPFAEARLCFSRPGRYDYVVSGSQVASEKNGAGSEYGTVIVE